MTPIVKLPRGLQAGLEAAAGRILDAALGAVDPGEAEQQHLRRDGDTLSCGPCRYDLRQIEHVYVTGAGKAGAAMLRAVVSILGSRLSGGVVAVKDGHAGVSGAIPSCVDLLEASHPLPDERSVNAARQIADLAAKAGPDDLLIVLLSGGGSSLITLPADGITLDDLRTTNDQLIKSGAAINEVNAVRKHLDRIKGGGLAGCAGGAPVVTLILSDVIGDALDVIASGPTTADISTFDQAMDVLQKYGLWAAVPVNVRRRLEDGAAGRLPETPKPGDPIFERVENIIIANNRMTVDAAGVQARREGFDVKIVAQPLSGEASQAGRALSLLAKQARQDAATARTVCVIAGGETTVTVRGRGLGGRNQELALAAVPPLADVPGALLVTLATDGGDGNSPAAGAVVRSDTLARAVSLGLDPLTSLENNDSYTFFHALGDAIVTGPTLTNVNDLAVVLLPS